MRFVRKGLCFHFVCELSEFVEIDARPETEGMRNHFRRRAPFRRCRFAQAGTDRAVDRFFEGDPKLLGALLQETR
jgi:hypothetical protein